MTPDHPGGHPYIRNTRSGKERISLFSPSFLTHNPGENHSDAGCVTLHNFVQLSSQQSGDTAFFDKGNSGVTVAIVGQALRVDVNLNVHAGQVELDKKRGDFKRWGERRGRPRPPKLDA